MQAASCQHASRPGKWAACLIIALASACLAPFPEELLRYERHADFSEGWRWLTGHFVHLGPVHLLVNLAGLMLICELFWSVLPVRHGVVVMLLAACVISLLLWFFHPDLHWYAGLSGVVHALWAACVSATLLLRTAADKQAHRPIAVAGAALLLLKLLCERMDILFPVMMAEGFPVVDVAHFYGAITGLAYVLLWCQSKVLSSRKWRFPFVFD